MKEVLRDRTEGVRRYVALVESGEALAALSIVRLRPVAGDESERLVLLADGLTLEETAEMIVNAAKAVDKAHERDRAEEPAPGPVEVDVTVGGEVPDGSIVAGGFAEYMSVTGGSDLPAAAQGALRNAFYGGAITVLGTMLAERPSPALIEAMDSELRAYCAETVEAMPSHARH
jgi:hypothetical protein